MEPNQSRKISRRFFFIVFILAVGLSLLMARIEAPGPTELRVLAGFFLFFMAPGILIKVLVLPGKKLLLFEWLPVSITLSIAAWAAPGLIAYSREWSLRATAAVELSIIGALFFMCLIRPLLARSHQSPAVRGESPSRATWISALLVGSALLTLAAWTGAFRDLGLDWDYFNYISAVRKLMAWDQASIAHFAYRDAPPDPIHSYNLWALQWALVGKLYSIDPIELYLKSAYLTVPAAAMAFFGLCRRLLRERTAVVALFLFAGYHVIYGGLIYLGGANFFPADSQWLIAFPTGLWLVTYVIEESAVRRTPRPGLLFAVALSALGLSATHVLWGLCFYLCLGLALWGLALKRLRAGRALARALSTGQAGLLVPALVLAAAPLFMTLVASLIMLARGETDGRTPLLFGENSALPGWLDCSVWMHAAMWVIVPAAVLGFLILTHRPRPGSQDLSGIEGSWPRALGWTLAACLVAAIPYVLLRHQVIQSTDWNQFGRNPYRAFITPELFFLNPFRRSLQDPNMTFYPFYFLSYLALPWLWVEAKKNRRAWLALAALIAVPLICFHPVLATLFAKFFSLGYLRRLLRLMAIFSMIPIAVALDGLVSRVAGEKRETLGLIISFTAAVGLSFLAIRFPADPVHYNHRLGRMIEVARTYPKDSLIFDESPFLAIREGELFAPGEVIFSDIWTGYRLTAYLPLFAAVQSKPGVGVPDQDERRLQEQEFFAAGTSPERRRGILDRFGATGVIIYRDLRYKLYGYPCGHPETITRLKGDPEHFELLIELREPEGHRGWAVFRYHQKNNP